MSKEYKERSDKAATLMEELEDGDFDVSISKEKAERGPNALVIALNKYRRESEDVAPNRRRKKKKIKGNPKRKRNSSKKRR